VDPPESLDGYAESLDWLEFRIDDAFRLLDWRVKLFRRLDPHHLIAAHGVAGTLETLPSSAHNEWRSAAMMDVWGLTWVASRKGNAPWLQYQALDLVRGGARGKPFWHAEAEGGPLWMQPQVIRPAKGGRPPARRRGCEDMEPDLLRGRSARHPLSSLEAAAGRAALRGVWPFAMDGSITPRAEMAGHVAKWANAHPDVWKSRPVKGDVGLVFIPESELFNYVQQGATEYYAQSIRGAYQAFFDSNIQADFVALEDIEEYKLVYLAYPVMLKRESVERLKQYVSNGGTLICEGLPAYFGDHGHVGRCSRTLAWMSYLALGRSTLSSTRTSPTN
jgi:beta-galactosidase